MKDGKLISYSQLINSDVGAEDLKRKIEFLLAIGSVILMLSILITYSLSKRKAKKEQAEFLNPTFIRATKALFVPVITGGSILIIVNK